MQDNANTESFISDLLPTHTKEDTKKICQLEQHCLTQLFFFYLSALLVSWLPLCVVKHLGVRVMISRRLLMEPKLCHQMQPQYQKALFALSSLSAALKVLPS